MPQLPLQIPKTLLPPFSPNLYDGLGPNAEENNLRKTNKKKRAKDTKGAKIGPDGSQCLAHDTNQGKKSVTYLGRAVPWRDIQCCFVL